MVGYGIMPETEGQTSTVLVLVLLVLSARPSDGDAHIWQVPDAYVAPAESRRSKCPGASLAWVSWLLHPLQGAFDDNQAICTDDTQ